MSVVGIVVCSLFMFRGVAGDGTQGCVLGERSSSELQPQPVACFKAQMLFTSVFLDLLVFCFRVDPLCVFSS